MNHICNWSVWLYVDAVTLVRIRDNNTYCSTPIAARRDITARNVRQEADMAALAHAPTLIVLGMLCAGATASIVHTQGTAGEQCEYGGRRCVFPEAYCKDGKCVCKDGFIGSGDFDCWQPKIGIRELGAIEKYVTSEDELFPFGSSAGDSLVPVVDDGSSGPISIAVNLPYFGGNYSKIFVNTNGGVSFESALTAFTPEDFPLQGDKPPVLTAYWGDVDTRNGGDIWYRQETGAALLDEVTNAIRSTSNNLRGFTADWLFVATWDRVAFYGASLTGRDYRNTFQVVLVYDSSSGCALALMNYDRLEWTCGTASGGDADTGLGGIPALAGFDAGDGVNFYKIPGSKTPDVLNLVNTSNVGVPGRYIFKINSAQIQSGSVESDPILRSMNGEKTDMPLTCRYLFTHFTSIYSKLPDSFCTLQIHLFQSKLQGKVYVEGLDIALKVESPSFPNGVTSFSARTYGNASRGLYTFDERGQLEFAPDGPWQEADGHLSAQLPGGNVALTYDADNNRAKFNVPDCGFKATFRPADMHLGIHVMPKAGVAVDVDPDHSPEFKENDRCLNIPPQQRHHLHDMAASLGVSCDQAQIYKVFMSGVPQNQPDAAPNCNEVPATLKDCPHAQLHDAMDKCHFIIAHHEVMQCLDISNNGNGNLVLGRYNRCLKAICSRSKVMCETVQSDLGQCQQFGEVKQFQRAETCDF